ncbi:MAG: serine O-acetyltransferase [Methylacidiphilales bacterium]|nr:serine O-acetyltransferase [Candidatus Methylacidiphilales bacterium]
MNHLTARLLDSYAEAGVINHIDGVNLPDKQAIERITLLLLQLLFPGYYEKLSVSGGELEAKIKGHLDSIACQLQQEIAKSLDYDPPAVRPSGDVPDAARKLACEFLSRLPEVREILVTDVEAAYDGDPAASSMDEIILAYPGLEAIAVYRLAHEMHRQHIALIPRMMTEWAHSRTGIDIHPGARIGAHFFIDHGTGVVIGETCVIGNHVKVYHSVTLGARSTSGGQQLRGSKRHPTLEDGVTIYPGATILGGETVIGAGSTIGGNVFLLHSVPPRSLVYYEEGAVLVKPKGPPDEDSGAGTDSIVYVI